MAPHAQTIFPQASDAGRMCKAFRAVPGPAPRREVPPELEFLSAGELMAVRRVMEQAEGDLMGLVRRLAGGAVLDIGREYGLGDQATLEAVINDHVDCAPDRPLFFWFERTVAERMYGHACSSQAESATDDVVLSKRIWAVLALSLHLEQFVGAHFAPTTARRHQQALLDRRWCEIQGVLCAEVSRSADCAASAKAAGDLAADRLVRHIQTLDGALRIQAERDAARLARAMDRRLPVSEAKAVEDLIVATYRQRRLLAGASNPRFRAVLGQLLSAPQAARIDAALAAIAPPTPCWTTFIARKFHVWNRDFDAGANGGRHGHRAPFDLDEHRPSPPCGRSVKGSGMRKITVSQVRGPALLAVLAALAAGVAGVHGARATPSTYLANQLDATQFLSPPPQVRSVQQRADLAAVRAWQDAKSGARWRQAQYDDELSPFVAFGGVLGSQFTPARAPKTKALFDVLFADVRSVTAPAKVAYARSRPPLMDASIATCRPLEPTQSYPSGHAARGWMMALILSEMVPERSNQLFARGRDYGDSRVVCAEHFPSDVEAGRLIGAAVAAAARQNPTFRHDLAAAKAELRHALKLAG